MFDIAASMVCYLEYLVYDVLEDCSVHCVTPIKLVLKSNEKSKQSAGSTNHQEMNCVEAPLADK